MIRAQFPSKYLGEMHYFNTKITHTSHYKAMLGRQCYSSKYLEHSHRHLTTEPLADIASQSHKALGEF